jgi:surfactin synthase thioesterase subunit
MLPGVEVCAAQLPARQDRLSDSAVTEVGILVARLLEAMEALPFMPTAFYGHSFGGLLAYELCRALEERGTKPTGLIVGARRGPQVAPPRSLTGLSDEAFIRALDEVYGTPLASLSRNEELLSLVMPSLRGDFGAMDGYRHVPGRLLETAVTVLVGLKDRRCASEGGRSWSAVTARPPSIYTVDAEHLFVDSHADWVCERVKQALAQ